tara:strand:+ start:12040 stop:12549 length:510 start_codon:yes stop_codon:yes gene_type:complete
MEVIDNFLEEDNLKDLQSYCLGADCLWSRFDAVTHKDGSKDQHQFVHGFYRNNAPDYHNDMNILNSILNKICPISIYRIKMNLLTKTTDIAVNTFHQDMYGLSKEKMKQWTTSIFYVNTNNGYTEFEDGTKVESVANRIVTFPSNTMHRGTSSTDQDARVIINFNYFAK